MTKRPAPLVVRFPDVDPLNLRARLAAACEAAGLSQSDLVRDALDAFLPPLDHASDGEPSDTPPEQAE